MSCTCPPGSYYCSCTPPGEVRTYVLGKVEPVRTISATPPPEVHPGLLQSSVIADLRANVDRLVKESVADAGHLARLSERLSAAEAYEGRTRRLLEQWESAYHRRLTALEAAAAAPPARKRSTSPAPRAASPSPKARRRKEGPSGSRTPARKAAVPRKRAGSRKRTRARSR